jgi:hypothetical protein
MFIYVDYIVMICYDRFIKERSDTMLTVNKVCEIFYVTPVTVYRWIKEGAPFIKVGSKWLCDDVQTLKQWHKERQK